MDLSFTYGDIPDSIPNKYFYPMSKNIWNIHKKLGWDYLEPRVSLMVKDFYEVVKIRLEESIQTAKDVNAGKIKNPNRVFTYFFFPPVLMIRSDLQAGATKLLYGESVDVSYIVLNDNMNEIAFVLNCHGESGIPVDWWFVGMGDELLDRRHRKLGLKFKNLTKLKNITETGIKATDILKDIRNERTPQWSKSPYYVIVVWGLGVANAGLEISNYENIAYIHDGVNYKKWGFPDANFLFAPFPSFLRMLFNLDRTSWTKKFAGISTESKLYCQHMLEKAYPMDWFMEHFTECHAMWVEKWTEKGIPFPSTSLNVKIPNIKKEIEKGTNKFDYKHDSNQGILLEDVGLSIEEALSGTYLDVDHEMEPKKLDHDDILSTNCGRDTRVLRD